MGSETGQEHGVRAGDSGVEDVSGDGDGEAGEGS